jgi:hypothetical protein
MKLFSEWLVDKFDEAVRRKKRIGFKKRLPSADVSMDAWIKAVEALSKDLEEYKKAKKIADQKAKEQKQKDLQKTKEQKQKDLQKTKEQKQKDLQKAKELVKKPKPEMVNGSKKPESEKDTQTVRKDKLENKDKKRLPKKAPRSTYNNKGRRGDR